MIWCSSSRRRSSSSTSDAVWKWTFSVTPSARHRRDAFAQVRDKDDLELYYKTIPDYFEQDDGRKLTEVPDRTSTDMIEGAY